MKKSICVSLFLLVAAGPGLLNGAEKEDLNSVKQVFARNTESIRKRDRASYLSCYLPSNRLAVTGPEGFSLGYETFAEESRPPSWPDAYEATDLALDWLKDGLVYGTYRYRVRYGAEEHAGLSERVFVRMPDGWKIAVTTAFDGGPGVPPSPRAIVGGTLIDGTGRAPIPDSVVVLRGGKIDCAGSRASCPLPERIDVVDARGNWITPGLVDAHVHFSQTGWADGRPDALDVRMRHPYEETLQELERNPERIFRADLCSGVTAVFDVGGYPWTLGLPARADADPRAPHVAAAGPLLSTLDHWLNLPAERQFLVLKDAESAKNGVAYLAARGSKAVKVWYIVTKDLPVEASAAAVEAAGAEAKKHGLPLIVHATGLAEAKAALRAGAKILVHSVDDLPIDDEFIALARRNGTIYCPTLTVIDGYLRMLEAAAGGRAPEIDDPNGCVDPATRARIAETAALKELVAPAQLERMRGRVARIDRVAPENLARVVRAGIPIAMGTDAGNPLTLHGPSVYTEMEAMQKAGMTPLDVLFASTRGGSLALGMEKTIGTIEKGKAADLILLTADPSTDIAHMRRIRAVVRGGALRSAEEGKAMVAATR